LAEPARAVAVDTDDLEDHAFAGGQHVGIGMTDFPALAVRGGERFDGSTSFRHAFQPRFEIVAENHRSVRRERGSVEDFPGVADLPRPKVAHAGSAKLALCDESDHPVFRDERPFGALGSGERFRV